MRRLGQITELLALLPLAFEHTLGNLLEIHEPLTVLRAAVPRALPEEALLLEVELTPAVTLVLLKVANVAVAVLELVCSLAFASVLAGRRRA